MKKLISIALMAMMVLPVFAGKTPKNWNFVLNDDAECIVERSYPTDKDGVAAIKAVRAAMNRQTFDFISVLSEEPGKSIVYQVKKNTKSRYNPFAGMFQESMDFKLTATFEDGKVNIHVAELMLQNVYAGFGAKVQSDSFVSKIEAYNEAEKASATAKGKAKKEALETMEDVNESLNGCQEELDKILDGFSKGL